MELGKHVLDKEMLGCDGRRAGKVDDLLLDVPEFSADGSSPAPVVLAILSGPLALAQNMPRWVRALAVLAYRLLGLTQLMPAEIPWRDVVAIDVIVHLSVPRRRGGWHALEESVRRRFIGHLPGA
ncbi:MAG TPA: hypothetical protein VGP33_14640 [Chloroflexota bacterium]|nr:hypothetical protein [Chloroflexota bacterium]